RLVYEKSKAIRRNIPCDAIQYIIEREPGSLVLQQLTRVKLRCIQGRQTSGAGDVHAIPDFAEPVFNSVPVRNQVLVRRNAKQWLRKRSLLNQIMGGRLSACEWHSIGSLNCARSDNALIWNRVIVRQQSSRIRDRAVAAWRESSRRIDRISPQKDA